jgi:fatty-acid desaturase
MMFKHKVWMTGLWQIVSTPVLLAALIYTIGGVVSPWWWLLSYVMLEFIVAGAVFGLHYRCCHSVYRTWRPLEYTFVYLGMLAMIGSGLQWCISHEAHHRFSDTDLDPHNTKSWSNMLLIGYVPSDWDFTYVKGLVSDPVHWWMHRNYLLLVAVVPILFTILDSSLHLLVFGYVIPSCLALWFGGLHNVVAHGGAIETRAPVDLPWYWRFLFRYEWAHKQHHDDPRGLPPGFTGWVIRRIRTDKPMRVVPK